MSVTFEEDTEAKVEVPAPQEVTPDVVQKKAKKPRTESQKAALLRAREALTTRRKKSKGDRRRAGANENGGAQ